MSLPLRAAALLGAVQIVFAASASGQQVVKPPLAQYWIDVATHRMAGMPEMPGLPGLGSMPMGAMGGQGGGGNHYGNARAMTPGRWLDLALVVRGKPAPADAAHAIPPAMQLGANLPLLPLVRTPSAREDGDPTAERPAGRPAGRLLIYWGCGEQVRPGQPRIIDLPGDPASFGRALAGRYAPDRGARVGPGYVLWPNERHHSTVPRGASLVGEHAIGGAGVPASMRFALAAAQDFMAPIQLASRGQLAGSVALQWQQVPHARAYFLHAMGTAGKDMILWSSSETPDTGMGLLDYLPNATIDRWVSERALLPATTTQCAVPKGIFAGSADGGAMLRMIAWGSELNLAHPPRPRDPRTPWEPEWSVRVRVKSTAMAMLGMDLDEEAAGRSSPERPPSAAQGDEDVSPRAGPSVVPGLPEAGRAIDAIKGLFGR